VCRQRPCDDAERCTGRYAALLADFVEDGKVVCTVIVDGHPPGVFVGVVWRAACRVGVVLHPVRVGACPATLFVGEPQRCEGAGLQGGLIK